MCGAAGTVVTPRNDTGQERDETGLLYYNARYYDPGLGRFISADTIVPGSGPLTVAPNDAVAASAWAASGGGPANPQDLNRYTYGLNNPVRNTDPTGHCIGWVWSASDCTFAGGNPANWSYGDALDSVQTGLDVVGLIPGAGEIADGANGAISLARGDEAAAALSFAAMVPVAGAGATAGKLVAKYGDEAAALVKQADNDIAQRSFRELADDYNTAPEKWDLLSAHTEQASRRGARQSGVSIQEIYRHSETREQIVIHTVLNNNGRVVDGPHPRPYYKPRQGEVAR